MAQTIFGAVALLSVELGVARRRRRVRVCETVAFEDVADGGRRGPSLFGPIHVQVLT